MSSSTDSTWAQRVVAAALANLPKEKQDELGLWCFELQPGTIQISRKDPEDGSVIVSRLDRSAHPIGVFQSLPNDEDHLIYDECSGYGNRELAVRLTSYSIAMLGRAVQGEPLVVTESAEFDWSDQWLTARIRVTFTKAWSTGFDHVEIRSIAADGQALPITDTGYRSHFSPAGTFEDLTDAVEATKQWLAEKSVNRKWRDYIRDGVQHDLFR